MSIYNFSVLKSNPITVKVGEGTLTLYRIKFYGKETYPGIRNYKSKHEFDIDAIRERMKGIWKEEKPIYGVSTAGHKGKLDFNDPIWRGEFSVYKLKGSVAFQEDDGIEQHIGFLKKNGKRYIFVEKDTEKTEISKLNNI